MVGMLPNRTEETPQTLQPTANAQDCPPDVYGKPIVLKVMCTLVVQHVKIYLVVT